MEDPQHIYNNRWADYRQFLARNTPFPNESGTLPNKEFEQGESAFSNLRDSKILVIGAGGLGSEILKNLALSGFSNVHVVDMDTIELTNLNRQFLFRESDVGRGKAEVAAEFIMRRVPTCKVTAHNCRIQDKDESFYRQFQVIVAGLDNVEARRWLNSFVIRMVQTDADGELVPETIIPIVDGGTEGFSGQARLIIPKVTACFECTLGLFPKPTLVQLCTIANKPRNAEHCIAYALEIAWTNHFGKDKKADLDNPEHIQWLFEIAEKRAKEFGITGVTYFKTLGVAKNIIPAIASTNAIIAAACTNECLKLVTGCSQSLHNYYFYVGSEGLNSETFAQEKLEECLVCSDNCNIRLEISISSTSTLSEFRNKLIEHPKLQLKNPSVSASRQSLYFPKPPSLEELLRPNLSKPMRELVSSGAVIHVNDEVLHSTAVSVVVHYIDE